MLQTNLFNTIELITELNQYIKNNLNDIQRLDIIDVFCSPSKSTSNFMYNEVISRIDSIIGSYNEISILVFNQLFEIDEDLVFSHIKHMIDSLSYDEKSEVLLNIDNSNSLSSKILEGFRNEIVYLSFYVNSLFLFIEDELSLLESN